MNLLHFRKIYYFIIFLSVISCSDNHSTSNWLNFQKDDKNSGVSPDTLLFPLNLQWQNISMYTPDPAWPAPAKKDYWHRYPNLAPRVIYDRAYHVTVKDKYLYYASSGDNKVYCLDAHSGKEKWSFFTEGPNRVVPTIYKNNIYVGSDDGNVYCLKSGNGELVWKYKAGETSRILPGNGRMISLCPVRTGIIAKNGKIYFAAGLFPGVEVYVVALDAETGEEIWKKKQDGLAPQGYPVVSDSLLYIPNSRATPYVFNMESGKKIKQLGGRGGTYLSITEQEILHGINHIKEITSDDFLLAAFNGHRMIFDKGYYFIATEKYLTSVHKSVNDKVFAERKELKEKLNEAIKELKNLRKNQKTSKTGLKFDKLLTEIEFLSQKINQLKGKEIDWRQEIDQCYIMSVSGNAVIVGQDNKVSAFSSKDGKLIWSSPVNGRAYGLAIAGKKLYVSTDSGEIYCFASRRKNSSKIIKQNITKNPYSGSKNEELYARTARQLISKAKVKKGYCLVLDCNEGQLAYQLAKNSQLTIIGIEEDPFKVRGAREKLSKAGIYGKQVTIFEGELKNIKFAPYFANLVVSDRMIFSGKTEAEPGQIFNLLTPITGVVYLGQPDKFLKISPGDLESWYNPDNNLSWNIESQDGLWTTAFRPKLENSGEWTHLYGNAANTSNSGDHLISGEMFPQWFGGPGPREMTDRHHRATAPLSLNGVLVVPKENGILGVDAYNGTLLWNHNIPEFKKTEIFKGAGILVASDDIVYTISEDKCYAYELRNGKLVNTFGLPQISEKINHWGYLATQGDKLFGSGRKPEAFYHKYGFENGHLINWGSFSELVTSKFLFAMDRNNGNVLWSYHSGVIINSAIAVGKDFIYFIESHNPKALGDQDGLVGLSNLKGKSYLCALDTENGQVRLKKSLDISVFQHIMYMVYYDNKIFLVGSKDIVPHVWYEVLCLNAINGSIIWHQKFNSRFLAGGTHGEQGRHPAILKNNIYVEPMALNLDTGEPVENWRLKRHGHACGTFSSSFDRLFFRADNPAFCVVEKSDDGQKLNQVSRPGCYINIIPAGGLILIPEASAGCTCDFPLQMSIAYGPKATVDQ